MMDTIITIIIVIVVITWSRGKQNLTFLSATLDKSGPLDFPSKKRFLLFLTHEKGLGHMFQK